MVSCDVCESWFHYECVGVDDSIEEKPWSCDVCSKLATSKEVAPPKKEEPKAVVPGELVGAKP